MIDSKTLGRRIRYFRNRSGLSQLEVESALGSSNGSLSRIENGEVNPLKETVRQLANIFQLNNREIDYLIGETASPATPEEIALAIDEIKEYFNKSGFFAYLLDDRWRIHYFSKSFYKLLDAESVDGTWALGKTTMQAALEGDSTIKKFFCPEHYEQMLQYNIPYYYGQTHFMEDDESFVETLKCIQSNPTAAKIWDHLSKGNSANYLDPDSRIVHFQVKGKCVQLRFSRESLLRNSRFEVVEFVPTNKFIAYISKLKF